MKIGAVEDAFQDDFSGYPMLIYHPNADITDSMDRNKGTICNSDTFLWMMLRETREQLGLGTTVNGRTTVNKESFHKV